MNSLLQESLTDVCGLLSQRHIRFALVGGIAASLRGRLRATEDVDLVLLTDVEGALELANSLGATPFQPLFPEFEKVVRSAYILALEHQPTGVPIDLAIGASGFEQQIVNRAQFVTIANTKVHVATAEDLILMKILAGRPQDDQDIAGMIAVQGSSIDWAYCESVAYQLAEVMEMDLVVMIQRLQKR